MTQEKTQHDVDNSELQELQPDIISPELNDILNSLNSEQRAIVLRSIQTFSGPIPHPSLLEGYNKVQPDLAERIVRMAEKEQEARHEFTKASVMGPIEATKRGQFMGFWIAVLFLAASLTLGIIGETWLAAALGGGTLVSLVTVFVTNKSTQNKEVANS